MAQARTVGIVTLPGFNEIDSFVATRMLDSVPGFTVELVGPTATATSMAGIEVATPGKLAGLGAYDAVVVGSGSRTFDHIDGGALMAEMGRGIATAKLIGSQCSGAAILHRLGVLGEMAVCTDRFTAPRLRELGVDVLAEAFNTDGKVATAGGCLSSTYLACWVIHELTDRSAAEEALLKVVPVGEEAAYLERVSAHIKGKPRSSSARAL